MPVGVASASSGSAATLVGRVAARQENRRPLYGVLSAADSAALVARVRSSYGASSSSSRFALRATSRSGSHHVEAIAIQDATQGDIDTFIAELLERPEYADDATLDAIKELDSAMKDVDAHLDNWEGYMSFVQEMAPNKEARERLERQYRSPSARMGSPQLEDVPQARSIPAKSAVAPQGRPVTSRVPMPPSTAGAPSVLSASASALGASSAPRLATSRSRARSSRTRAWGREDKRSPEAPDIGRARAHANRTRRERGADKSSDGLRMFLREIGRHTLLTAEEERELSRAVQAQIEASEKRRALSEELGREPSPAEVAAALAISEEELKEREQLGTESRQRMVQCNLRLVVSIAKKYRDRGLEMNDLVAEGIIGLTRAVDKFDPSRGFKFSTYAHWWIRQGVTRAISEQARVVRLPVHLYEIMSKIRKAERDIVVRTGRDPSHEDLAEAVGISVKKIELLFKAYRPTLSMDQPIKSADSESSSLMELVEDTHQQSPEETSVQSQLSGHLEDLLNTLNDRERRILRLRYGLDDGREHTLEDIGRIFNVTRERIRQIECKAMKRLKSKERSGVLHEYLGDGSGSIETAMLPSFRRGGLKKSGF